LICINPRCCAFQVESRNLPGSGHLSIGDFVVFSNAALIY